jgi:ubiquinone/menaquinone biosynthesis C-methylase UbiE
LSESDRIARAFRDLEQRSEGRYSLDNRGNQQILSERRAVTRKLLERQGWIPIGERRVLEVGSGSGWELAWLLELGASPASLVGIDLLPHRVAAAKAAFPALEFHAGNAEQIPFPDASFDLVQSITLFSSIFDEAMASRVAAEITRVLRPGGALLWYDFRYDNPSNRDVHKVTTADVRALFPTLQGELVGITLVPPLARRLGRLAPVAYLSLASVPFLRSHLIGLLRKPAA